MSDQVVFQITVYKLAYPWEKKTYSPLNNKANWFADGKEMDYLPKDFYSSKYYIDKAIEFIESNRQDGLPFFSYIAFQAVHTPVQAPQEYTDKYMGKYDAGWQRLREDRLESAKAKHIVPPGTKMVKMGSTGITRPWEPGAAT